MKAEFPTIVYCQSESKKKPEHVIIVLKTGPDHPDLQTRPMVNMMQKGTEKARSKITTINVEFNRLFGIKMFVAVPTICLCMFDLSEV